MVARERDERIVWAERNCCHLYTLAGESERRLARCLWASHEQEECPQRALRAGHLPLGPRAHLSCIASAIALGRRLLFS